jgi:hypothetical protein
MKPNQNFLLAGAFALSALASTGHAAVVFDDISAYQAGVTGAGVSAVSSPNQSIGDAFTLAPGTVDITGFDLYPVNLVSNKTYNALKLNIYVWGGVNTGTVSASSPAFSDLLGSYSATFTGSFPTGYFFSFESANPGVTPGISLAAPLAVTGPSVGISINVQGSTNGGATYSTVTNLTSLITYGAAPTVGSEPFSGFYASTGNSSNYTTGPYAFTSGYSNEGLALRIYGDIAAVPEPASSALMALGVATLLMVRRRRA